MYSRSLSLSLSRPLKGGTRPSYSSDLARTLREQLGFCVSFEPVGYSCRHHANANQDSPCVEVCKELLFVGYLATLSKNIRVFVQPNFDF